MVIACELTTVNISKYRQRDFTIIRGGRYGYLWRSLCISAAFATHNQNDRHG